MCTGWLQVLVVLGFRQKPCGLTWAIEFEPYRLQGQSLSHWATREVPTFCLDLGRLQKGVVCEHFMEPYTYDLCLSSDKRLKEKKNTSSVKTLADWLKHGSPAPGP